MLKNVKLFFKQTIFPREFFMDIGYLLSFVVYFQALSFTNRKQVITVYLECFFFLFLYSKCYDSPLALNKTCYYSNTN